jgi:hypothetical protein
MTGRQFRADRGGAFTDAARAVGALGDAMRVARRSELPVHEQGIGVPPARAVLPRIPSAGDAGLRREPVPRGDTVAVGARPANCRTVWRAATRERREPTAVNARAARAPVLDGGYRADAGPGTVLVIETPGGGGPRATVDRHRTSRRRDR